MSPAEGGRVRWGGEGDHLYCFKKKKVFVLCSGSIWNLKFPG